jgi:hypothetical protein
LKEKYFLRTAENRFGTTLMPVKRNEEESQTGGSASASSSNRGGGDSLMQLVGRNRKALESFFSAERWPWGNTSDGALRGD